jgi:DNA-binding NarL/FixJ family response regulator
MNTILILEDHPDALELLIDIIGNSFPAATAHTALSCGEARSLIADHQFDLALIDLHLPDGSGCDIIQQLNIQSPDTRIVVSTIYGDDGRLFPALQAGAHGYLLKDDPRDSLIRQLTGIIEGTPPLSPAIARKLILHFNEPPQEQRSEHRLTPREQEALTFLAKGISVKQLAHAMNISPYTAADHVKSIYRKLNITSRAEAALKATELGLLPH